MNHFLSSHCVDRPVDNRIFYSQILLQCISMQYLLWIYFDCNTYGAEFENIHTTPAYLCMHVLCIQMHGIDNETVLLLKQIGANWVLLVVMCAW